MHHHQKPGPPPRRYWATYDAGGPISTEHTPESLAQALSQRWQAATPEMHLAMGRRAWDGLLEVPVGELLPYPLVEETLKQVLVRHVVCAFFDRLPQENARLDIERLRASGLTLAEVLGPSACELLREGAQRPWKPNRELLEELLDQPMLRHALKNMVQKTIQQFLTQVAQLTPLGGGGAAGSARGSVLGALGRGIANRAEKAAQIGKTFMEGMGGTVFRQVEEQLQPFLSAFMGRSVKTLTEALFEGEQAGLASEARLRALEVLLASPMSRLLAEATPEEHGHVHQVLRAISAHLVTLPGYREAIQRIALDFHTRLSARTLKQALSDYRLPEQPDPRFLEALGQLIYGHLSRQLTADFLREELAAVW
jgi:hypothetical protein